VYNGGCSNVLTCLVKESQSPMYMPSWLSERCCCPVHVMSWPSEEHLGCHHYLFYRGEPDGTPVLFPVA
jgi:hypothetical protein